MNNEHTIIVSFDAVSSKDLEYLKKLPNFSGVINGGALIKKVETVYPSLTYPVHVSIVTGKKPINHGIVNNTKLEINNENPNWYWYRKDIKGETLFDLAEKNNLKTCAILWPVTGKGRIKYNMPEIFCNRPWENQIIKSAVAGSMLYQLNMSNRFGKFREGLKQPQLDNFAMEVAKATIIEKKPNLMLLHLVDVDTQKHYHGCNSSEVKEALLRHERRLGEIINALKEANIYEKSTLILLGDHSQLDTDKLIRLNSLFVEKELIKINRKNKVKSYKAITKSCDGSCYVYLKDKSSIREVQEILLEEMNKEQSGIEKIFTREEAIDLGVDKNCDFIIEAKKGYYFIDDTSGKTYEKVNKEKIGVIKHRLSAAHGYLPKKEEYSTFFIAKGNSIKKGLILENGQLINHGPTIAEIMGLDLEEADGVVERRIFK